MTPFLVSLNKPSAKAYRTILGQLAPQFKIYEVKVALPGLD